MMPHPRVVRSPGAPPPGAREWAYALGAVYNVAHGLPVDAVALPADAEEARADAAMLREMLSGDWDAPDRAALVDRLNGLGDGGHRRRHGALLRHYATLWRPEVAALREEMRADIREGGEDAADAAAALWRLDAVQADWRGVRASPLLAFDAARAAMLVRAGFMLGWLGEEAWDYLLDAARDVRRTYGSWAAYGADFLLSRSVWAGSGERDVFDHVVELLLRDRASPWVRLPWDAPPLPVPRPVRPLAEGVPAWSLELG